MYTKETSTLPHVLTDKDGLSYWNSISYVDPNFERIFILFAKFENEVHSTPTEGGLPHKGLPCVLLTFPFYGEMDGKDVGRIVEKLENENPTNAIVFDLKSISEISQVALKTSIGGREYRGTSFKVDATINQDYVRVLMSAARSEQEL